MELQEFLTWIEDGMLRADCHKSFAQAFKTYVDGIVASSVAAEGSAEGAAGSSQGATDGSAGGATELPSEAESAEEEKKDGEQSDDDMDIDDVPDFGVDSPSQEPEVLPGGLLINAPRDIVYALGFWQRARPPPTPRWSRITEEALRENGGVAGGEREETTDNFPPGSLVALDAEGREDAIGRAAARRGRLAVDCVRNPGPEVAVDAALREMTTQKFQDLAEVSGDAVMNLLRCLGSKEPEDWTLPTTTFASGASPVGRRTSRGDFSYVHSGIKSH